MMRSYFWVGLGGGLGAVLRYSLSSWIPGQAFPWNFLTINLSGSFVIGMIMALAIDFSVLSQEIRLFVAVGVLGGYTTFSTFMYGTYHLALADKDLGAAIYVMVSIIGGLAACGFGIGLVRASMSALRNHQDSSP
ncbi:MAG: fluoride efflux transporter CrcB [Sulfobacillus sp.]